MICSCDRPMPLEDGDCLKCGREVRPVTAAPPVAVDEYIAALERLSADEYRVVLEAAGVGELRDR